MLFSYFNSNILYHCIFCSFFLYSVVFCNLCFRMFCSKHSITFENMYLLCSLFYCADIFYIKFRFSELFTVINSVTRNLLIETWIQIFYISHLAFSRFTFHWYWHCSNSNYQKYGRLFQPIKLHFNVTGILSILNAITKLTK